MKPKTYSPHYLSIEFGLDRATALRILKDVAPDEAAKGRGTYTTATFARALEAHHLNNASNNNDGNGDGTESATAGLTAARLRVTLANAEAKERTNALARGALVDAAGIVESIAPVFATIREVNLGMAGKIADALTPFTPKDRTAIFDIVHREVIENLKTLSDPETYAAMASASYVPPPPAAIDCDDSDDADDAAIANTEEAEQ
jgi:phage terminase Nu1 subunit (DNA packaging protein)